MKGGQTRDIPLPESVMTYLHTYVERLALAMGQIGPETPLFWSLWGRANRWEESSTDAREKYLAALQNLWTAHRVPDAETS